MLETLIVLYAIAEGTLWALLAYADYPGIRGYSIATAIALALGSLGLGIGYAVSL